MTINPQDIERALLGSILFSPEIIDEIRLVLTPIDFVYSDHKEIYKIMLQLADSDLPIEETFILKELKNNVSVQKSLIEILSANAITNYNAYAKEIKEISLKRELDKLSFFLQESNTEHNSTKTLRLVKEKLEEIEKNGKMNAIESQDIHEILSKDTNYICKTFLPFPENQVSLAVALGGTGKTFLLLRVALEILKENKEKKVFCWLSEDDNSKSKSRVIEIAKMANMNLSMINKGHLILSDDMPIDIIEEVNRKLQPTEDFYKLKNQLKEFDVLIFDPLIGFFSASENENSYAKRLMLQFVSWAKKERKTIIFIHHTTKDGENSRGASAINDAARLVYIIKSQKDNDGSVIKNGLVDIVISKDNNNIREVMDEFSKNNGKITRRIFPYNNIPSVVSYMFQEELDLPDLVDLPDL